MLTRGAWVALATEGIVSPKERESVRQELMDHIADHMEALQAAGLSAEEAEEQAVAAMGDPNAVGALLRKIHQPVLTRILQICRWTAIVLAAVLVLQLAISLFDRNRGILDRLWCDDPLIIYGYAYFQTDELPEGILARRVADTEGAVDLGDYRLKPLKASLERREEGTRVILLLELKADRLWYIPPQLHGTMTVVCGGGTFSQERMWHSYYRRLRRHYLLTFAEFEGDLLEEDGLTLAFANEERSFTLPITLEGGDVHET